MPKRIVDGDALWRSDTFLQLPIKYRGEFAWLYPLALGNGTFEADDHKIWATAYAYNRPDFTLEEVRTMLAEFDRVKLLFRWEDDSGKLWGFWVGSEKKGRLPTDARLNGRHEKIGEGLPVKLYEDWLNGKSLNNQRSANGRPTASLGFGFGLGIGSGIGFGTGQVESLTGEDMAFNQNIANTAAEILKFTKGLTTHEKGELKLLARAYGTDRVETDFEAWARENRGGNIQYPISLYLKKASARLESEPEPEIADDPRIRQVTAKVYEMTGRLPINADLTNITKWLTKYSVEDIITGFSEYLHGLDGFEQKWAVKNYFSGGGEVVLEAIALRRASEKKWVVSEEESDFTAIRRDEGPVNDEI